MKHIMLVIPADKEQDHIITELDRAPTLKELQRAVGGFIELIPGFNAFFFGSATHKCETYGDEDGKPSGKPLNERATRAWHAQLPHRTADYLVGAIAVVFKQKDEAQ